MARKETLNDWYIKEARRLYGEEGEVEIDDGAKRSDCDDGAWVQAWVWVPKEKETKCP